MDYLKKNWIKFVVHIGALTPITWLLWHFYGSGDFIIDPIREATLFTGRTTLYLLLITLAVTPLNTVFKFRQGLKVRQELGLYTFFYASIHLIIFLYFDYKLDPSLLVEALIEKRYTILGSLAWLMMLPMAITSTKGWKKRLGKKWKQLHRLVYAVGVAAIIHFIWLVKPGVLDPYPFAGAMALLLIARIPAVRRWASRIIK